MSFGIRFQWAGGSTLVFDADVPEGAWLAAYDPDAERIEWTTEPAKAMRFVDGKAAVECYRTQSRTTPLRYDGKPNRPLTAYTISLQTVVE